MEQLSGRQASPVSVSPEVRDRARQQQSFWDFLTGTYKSELGEKVIMPRLFLNHAIQRWFRAVWNLDRILVHENRIWLLEIKHKFPFGRKELRFGINRGELGVFSRLSEAGIDCFHAILAKPSWTRDTGSGYLLNQLEQREHAALIGCILDQEVIHRMQQGPQGSSPSHTTFTRRSVVLQLFASFCFQTTWNDHCFQSCSGRQPCTSTRKLRPSSSN